MTAKTGYYVPVSTVGKKCMAFVPNKLPSASDLNITPELREKLDSALLALGRLDSISLLLPDIALFLYMYIRKEAVLSSQIEGTQSSLSDLLLYEHKMIPGVPLEDVQEVSNYVSALKHGINRIQEGFPISSRLIKELHEILLSKGRGSDKQPGDFRQSQNWIGGTRPGNASFVPPPQDMIQSCIGDLEQYINDKDEKTPVLIKSALAHIQFETIHPFLDGNGRVGRLLIPMILCEKKVLKEPLLYLSLFFKTHRNRYYELLQKTRIEGCWNEWLLFFAEAVDSTASQAFKTVEMLEKIQKEDRDVISNLGRISGSAIQTYNAVLKSLYITPKTLCDSIKISPATANKILKEMANKGILKETSGKERNRLYSYHRYLSILNMES